MEYLSSRLGVSIKQFDAKGTEAKTRSLTDLFWVFNVAYFILRIFTENFFFFNSVTQASLFILRPESDVRILYRLQAHSLREHPVFSAQVLVSPATTGNTSAVRRLAGTTLIPKLFNTRS